MRKGCVMHAIVRERPTQADMVGRPKEEGGLLPGGGYFDVTRRPPPRHEQSTDLQMRTLRAPGLEGGGTIRAP
eukprot:1192643-Prorocentrum_minimum.AAC.2